MVQNSMCLASHVSKLIVNIFAWGSKQRANRLFFLLIVNFHFTKKEYDEFRGSTEILDDKNPCRSSVKWLVHWDVINDWCHPLMMETQTPEGELYWEP